MSFDSKNCNSKPIRKTPTSIDQRYDAGLVQLLRLLLVLEHTDQHAVDPSASDDRVQAADDDVELSVEALVLLLDATEVRGDLNAGQFAVDVVGGHLGLRSADVLVSKQELPVQVRQVDRVHVDHVDLIEAHQRQFGQQLAAQSAAADHQNAAFVREEVQVRIARLEVRPTERSGALEYFA